MEKDLQKLAAVAIRQLQNDFEKLASEKHSLDEAIKLAFDLHNQGAIVAEDLQEKIAEFSHKSLSELEVIRKATELTKLANKESLFKLSSRFSDNGNIDPLTRMLLEDIY